MSVEDSGAKKDGSGAGAGPFAPGNLVVYKSAPARVLTAGQKIEIETAEGSRVSVRGKDILLLHPGPVSSLRFDLPPAGEVREAWEMLQGQRTTAAEFAELLFGTSGPGECWAVYSLALDGLYARGTPGDFILLSREEHQAVADARDEAEREARERSLLLDRLRTGKTLPQDRKPLREVEDVAFGRSGTSRILRDLKIPNLPEKAHALLLKLGVWDESVNPHPARLGLSLEGAFPALEDYPDGERLDLTGLPAFAVDDEGSEDPDDAISVDGDTLWVHIADPAQAVRPGTEADLFARERGANLYLPEGKVPMLPPETTERFGLGLGDTSPALSFAVKLAPDGSLAEHRILLTRVRVTRLSFREAQERLDQGPLRDIHAVTSRYNAFRRKNGAVSLRLPEVKIRAASGEVTIRPLPPTDAQTMVTDAMLMAGEAAARYAIEKGLPLPYASQEPPDSPCDPRTLSEMWACRRQMRAGSVSSFPAPHAGLGLSVYTRVSSPLRRYLDLVAHQQIRAHILGMPLLSAQEITLRIGASEAVTGGVQKAERLSNLHWTLVHLRRHPDRVFPAMAVENQGRHWVVLIPELGLEARVNLPRGTVPDGEVTVRCAGIDLPGLEVGFVRA